METRARYTIIGLFTLLVATIAFLMIYWVGRLDQVGETVNVEIEFPGTVSGLIAGSSVNFNGIRVGTVNGLRLDPTNPEVVLVDVEISRTTPLKSNTNISLGTVGLTGASFVDMRGGSPENPDLLQQPDIGRLQADSASVEDLMQAAQDVMGRVDQVAREIDALVERNSENIDAIIENAVVFSEALASNAEGIDDFLANTSDAATKIGALATRLEGLTDQVETVVSAVDPAQVSSTLDNIETFTGTMNSSASELNTLITESRTAISTFADVGASLQNTLGGIDGLVAAIPPDELTMIVSDVSILTQVLQESSDSIRTIVADAQAGTQSFRNFAAQVEGEGDRISQITTNAVELTDTLNQSAQRLDRIFNGVDDLLTDEDGGTLIADLRETLQAFRQAAATFELRIGEISAGVSRFSGTGLRNLDGLISDGRTAIGRLNNLLRQLEESPRQFISGGGGVPSYNGRPRR